MVRMGTHVLGASTGASSGAVQPCKPTAVDESKTVTLKINGMTRLNRHARFINAIR